ncbi:LysR family transcriptional regulator [Desulfobacula sp.]|uniref:LysR family transcriptional regulator n=1 Tax=Desulfobacula sp. TaxID=2593537 RepID=UPI002610648A|nr:LysR family transcriptional regulator [Desulfobacula sp.]
MINYNYLRSFYHVAKNLSFTLAAEDLFVTQPAITRQVKVLENLWEMKLFENSRGKIYLTEEGKYLFDYVKKVFDYEKEIEMAVEDIRGLKQGVLRLSTTTYVPNFMAFLTNKFKKKYPHIKVQLNHIGSEDSINMLRMGHSEIAIMPMVKEYTDVDFIHLDNPEVILVVNPDHPLALKGVASLEDLSREPLILKEPGSGTAKVVADFFKQHHITPNIFFELGDTESIKRMVQRGHGVSLLVEYTVSREISEGKLVSIPIEEHKIFLPIHIVYLKDRHFSLPAIAFLNILSKVAPGSPHFPHLASSWPKDCPFM